MNLDVHLPAIAAGDPQAFAAWLVGAEASVRSSLRSFARVIDTEAILQEALLRTWQVAPKVERDGWPNTLLRLAVRIARNAAIDEVRRARLDPTEIDALERALQDRAPPDPSPADPFLRRAIAACRDALPPRPGQALAARLAGGGSDRDVAAAAGMKLNTFLQNVGRARRLLVACLATSGIVVEVP